MATISDSIGSANKNHATHDDIREYQFAAMTPNDSTAVIDTSGYDQAYFVIGAGTRPTSGTTEFVVFALNDSSGTVQGSVAEEAGYHIRADVSNGAASYNAGYMKGLPPYIKVTANSGSGTSIDLHVFLRKTRAQVNY